jgi:hypothetical protein
MNSFDGACGISTGWALDFPVPRKRMGARPADVHVIRPRRARRAREIHIDFAKDPLRRLAVLAAIGLAGPALAQDDLFASRPAFSRGDQPAARQATCENVRAMAEGLGEPDFRIDLSIGGVLTLVRTDGVLWQLVMCSDLRIMDVTYERNNMQVGERVYFSGAYRRLDANHAVLDPCLANRAAALEQ